MTDATTHSPTAFQVLDAAREVLLETGFNGLSTRKVAEHAGVPLSQIHYHFGSKANLILALLRWQDEPLIERQNAMFAADEPLSSRWVRSCDFLDADLASGYVRVLNEMVAAGWSSPGVRSAVHDVLDGWAAAHGTVLDEARAGGYDLGPFTTAEIIALVHALFLGAEALLLLDRESDDLPIRQALRRVGDALAAHERSHHEATDDRATTT